MSQTYLRSRAVSSKHAAVVCAVFCAVACLTIEFAEPREAISSQASAAKTITKFSPRLVDNEAEVLALKPYVASAYEPPEPLGQFGYDEYRDIRFRNDRAIWRSGDDVGLSVQFFLASFIHRDRVEIEIVEDGIAKPIEAHRDMFDFGASDARVPQSGEFAFSGFRFHGPLNRRGVADEVLAFNGASYFRALGRNHSYGLSARGLALNTIGPPAEEFPRFVKFWLEKPAGVSRFTIHALLDSPSVAGAYHFVVSPGAPTEIDLTAVLFPRTILDNVGLAPLTSMFLFDSRNHDRFNDFRAAVHDSDGLAIYYASGERLWRPLLNPSSLQASRFAGSAVRGFGLVQRARRYEDYYDLEAHYQKRPSAWIEPQGDWGEGSVELLELPIGAEWGDNIVAFWRPKAALTPWQPFRFAYRSFWGDEVPRPARRIIQTRKGIENGKLIFAIDHEHPSRRGAATAKPKVSASAGKVSEPIVQTDPNTDSMRSFFTFDPGDATVADLRLTLTDADGLPDATSETWTYRWVK